MIKIYNFIDIINNHIQLSLMNTNNILHQYMMHHINTTPLHYKRYNINKI